MLMKYDKNETTKYSIYGEAEPSISSVLQGKGVFEGCTVSISFNYWNRL